MITIFEAEIKINLFNLAYRFNNDVKTLRPLMVFGISVITIFSIFTLNFNIYLNIQT